jgi:hypothetical protein
MLVIPAMQEAPGPGWLGIQKDFTSKITRKVSGAESQTIQYLPNRHEV